MSARSAIRLLVAASLLLCSSFFHPARAAEAHAETRTVLFVVETPTAFSARLRAELEAMGFDITSAPVVDDGVVPVIAAVRVINVPGPRRVEVWIANRSTGRLELSALVQPSPDDDEASQTVRASEQLRAFFQPLRESSAATAPLPADTATALPPAIPPAEPPPSATPPPLAFPPSTTPPASPSAPVEPRRFTVAASLALPIDAGGVGVDALIQGRWALTRRLGVGGVFAVPLSGTALRSGANSADVSATFLNAELSITVVESRALRLTGNAGVGVAWLRTRGVATAPYTGKSDDAWVALPLIGIEVAPKLSEWVRLCLGARVGLALPRTDIAFADQSVANWGWPLAVLSAGVSVDL
jgi:hypothetical protein